MKVIICVLVFTLILSCQEKTTEVTSQSITEIPKVNNEFQIFLDKFPEIQLPISIEGCNYDYTKLKQLDNGTYAIGKIATNGNYIATISLSPADCLLPILTTYTPSGKEIDSKTIAIGYCDDGPCYECKEYMIINNAFEVYTCDTIKHYYCDEDYNEVKGTERIEVIYKKGSLNSNGKIELSDELKKKL